jgi:hypothetical protein
MEDPAQLVADTVATSRAADTQVHDERLGRFVWPEIDPQPGERTTARELVERVSEPRAIRRRHEVCERLAAEQQARQAQQLARTRVGLEDHAARVRRQVGLGRVIEHLAVAPALDAQRVLQAAQAIRMRQQLLFRQA